MYDVNNCGTAQQGGLGRTCSAEGVGVGRASTDAGEDHSPTNIMHAAYVGALELIKSMVAVSGRDEINLGYLWGYCSVGSSWRRPLRMKWSLGRQVKLCSCLYLPSYRCKESRCGRQSVVLCILDPVWCAFRYTKRVDFDCGCECTPTAPSHRVLWFVLVLELI